MVSKIALQCKSLFTKATIADHDLKTFCIVIIFMSFGRKGQSLNSFGLVGIDPLSDLAVLKIKGKNLLKFGKKKN